MVIFRYQKRQLKQKTQSQPARLPEPDIRPPFQKRLCARPALRRKESPTPLWGARAEIVHNMQRVCSLEVSLPVDADPDFVSQINITLVVSVIKVGNLGLHPEVFLEVAGRPAQPSHNVPLRSL